MPYGYPRTEEERAARHKRIYGDKPPEMRRYRKRYPKGYQGYRRYDQNERMGVLGRIKSFFADRPKLLDQEGEIIEMAQVKDLPREHNLQFVSDSQDVYAIKGHLSMLVPKDLVEDYDSFFVSVEDGEYDEAWGMHGTVPYNDKYVYRLI